MESDYDRKFEEMKNYIPFLERMIKKLETTSSSSPVNPRQAQLDKIRSLRDLLLDKNKRMKMENLLKCEQVLVNLCAKVEKGDPFTDIKPSTKDNPKEKSDLETVRNKLKTVTKIREDVETLPEIARANDVEQHYTGSKEPALFQRRPNISKSPTRPAQKTSDPKTKSPQASQSRRSYTRVLVSPDQSPRPWSASEQPSSEKPLFSRRSPPLQAPSPPIIRKDKKKSSKQKSRKNNDLNKYDNLNITLNVPEESLNSINTEDILSRIINCSDGDVDIDTLRDLRSQILGELKQTGKNDDISDLILKSYNKKTKHKKQFKVRRKGEVEEGEISDSESEAIESIYSSLVVMDSDKNKKSHTQVKTIEDKDNQQRKIQICLVINSDKDAANKESEQPQKVIDLSELEMYSDSEGNKSKDIISIDSDTSLSPPKKTTNKQVSDNSQTKEKIDQVKNKTIFSSPLKTKPKEINAEVISINEYDDVNTNQTIETVVTDNVNNGLEQKSEGGRSITNITSNFENPLRLVTGEVTKSPMKIVDEPQSKLDLELGHNTEPVQENFEHPPTFSANFYKPIEDNQNTEPAKSFDSDDPPKIKTSEPSNKASSVSNDTAVKELDSAGKNKSDDSQKIPLLNEPTVPPKAQTNVLSEIDILQALKNEILSGTIAVPGSEAGTPALHQPKLTKVASAQEVMPKKRISIEKYKEKASTTSKPLFIRKRNKLREERIKKQSLKLTEKECERFNVPKRLSLDDDDDVDDFSDDDFLSEDRDDSLGLDDIYGDLAPKSPDNEDTEGFTKSNVSPVIIPTDPIKTLVVSSVSDVDMRSLLPMMSPQQQSVPQLSLPVPQPVPPPLIPPLSFDALTPSTPVYGLDRPISDAKTDQSNKFTDKNRLSALDPRMRRDAAINPDRTPRSTPFSNAPNMTPNRTPSMNPSMTPSLNPNMTPSRTPSYAPSMPLMMTPNARSFEMTPSHQSFELEESSTRKHVYAPSFSVCDNRERELSVSKEPHWEVSRSDPRGNRKSRWEESNFPTWEGREPRGSSGQSDGSLTPRYDDSYKSTRYDKFLNRARNEDRRDPHGKSDCPSTPLPSFGWSDCPPTPGNAFGRQEPPMTPSHYFGRSECPSTPSHSFGRTDCSSTPVHPFGRGDCPSTPVASFGRVDTSMTSFTRSECPSTPSNSFGRSECPATPTHSFGQSEVPFGRQDASNNQKFNKDPRLNRRPSGYEPSSYNERDCDYERTHRSSSYKSQNKNYSGRDMYRNYEREKSVGRNERNYGGDRDGRQCDRDRREQSLGRSLPDSENEGLYSRSRESRYDSRHSRTYDDVSSRRDHRERSIGRTTENRLSDDIARSRSRAPSVGRSFGRDNTSLKSDVSRDFTINTSVKTTFQDFLKTGRPMQVFDYTFDARRQRAASVGRSLVREKSVVHSLVTDAKSSEYSNYSKTRQENFKRASSVGRELANKNEKNEKNEKSFKEVKALFESYRSKANLNKIVANKEADKDENRAKPRGKKDIEAPQQDRKYSQSKQQYSPRKNYRDPRMRKETPAEHKSRYKIDRRFETNRQRSGIVYSSDNIAKGTIMGSGFGVKNYKIPKIKRAVVETEEVCTKDNEKTELIEKTETKDKKKLKVTESDKKAKIKDTKEIVEDKPPVTAKIINQSDNKNETETKCQPQIRKETESVDDSEKRVTRSKKKMENKQSQENDSVARPRRAKKTVIYDSESDSGTENEIFEKDALETTSKLNYPSKKATNSKKPTSPVKQKVAKKKPEEILNSSFGIDDMEMFSENIASDPVIENINALIADLDNDLDSKIPNDCFNTEIEDMMEAINSPEGNSLGDISEVIEKDLNESSAKLQLSSVAENLFRETEKQNSVPHTRGGNNEANKTGLDSSELLNRESSKEIKDSTIKKAINEVPVGESVDEQVLNDTSLSKVNEAIVSTTGIDQASKSNAGNSVENEEKKGDPSIPDSTINKNLDKTDDGLPDSTNEMHCEFSSDVTSTYDASETSKKEPDLQSASQKEPFNSIESLLSILQHKSKIKELLFMLGDQSSGNEKIMRKLEKLSEMVSDEEDENEDQSKVDDVKDPLFKSEMHEKQVRENNPVAIDKKIEQEITKDVPNTDKVFATDESIEKETFKEKTEENIDDSKVESIIKDVNKACDEKSIPPLEKMDKNLSIPINCEKEKVPTSKQENEINKEETKERKKSDDDAEEDDMDDKPLIETKLKVTKQIKGRAKRFKPRSNKNKLATRAKALKTQAKKSNGVKKPAARKKPSELQKLQDDIKEMFIRDEILNATGIRMCRLAKMVTENEDHKKYVQDSEPVVVLEKVKELQVLDQPPKIRKKPGPKPKNKSATDVDLEKDTKMDKPEARLKYKPGPKCRTKQKKSEDIDPYEFDTDSITDTNTPRESDEESSDSESESLASSRSFGSTDVLTDAKKKPKRKRRGARGWQSGIIKPKHRKKKEQKQESPSDDSPIAKPYRPITIPDLNCFTDRTYCFQKGVTTYDCRLCVFSGADIVNHYKKQHPHTEIPLSRMNPRTAELAVLQCEDINFQTISKIRSEKYTCRFCYKDFGQSRVALETFFWHVVSHHTGEFKHLCSECVNVARCPFNIDIPPPPKDGGQLIGFICGKCNFTQVSLENLKTHVIVRHNDEQTEVYKINMAVMSNKAMKAMLRRVEAKPRVVRSLRSNRSAGDASVLQDDRSDITDTSDRANSESDTDPNEVEENQVKEQKQNDVHTPKLDRMRTKLTFENDEPSDDTSVKMEEEEHEADDPDDTSHFDQTFNADLAEPTIAIETPRGNSDEIVDYPHFKINFTDSGAKEYVCCINGNDSHYKTSLLISMKKHIQSKHTEKWDGYCCLCKVIVTLQGVTSDFKDCLTHFLDKHMDDFPVLEKVVVSEKEGSLTEPEPPLPSLPTSLPARVATPPVERTASPSYIAVRPLAELLSKELVKESPIEAETPISFPKIENVVSLIEATAPVSSPVYPTMAPIVQPDKPFLYEDVQAEVMSKKHRVVLDAMMAKENLVRVFKCAGRFCSFTSDSAEDALLHASTHQRVGGEGALNCSYCNYDTCGNGIDLVMHVFKEHSKCQYCCPLCFYRAAASQLVGVHYKKAHGSMRLQKILKSTSAVGPQDPTNTGVLSREAAVQHFICNHDDGSCQYKTYTPGKFTEHIQQKHASKTSHPCYLCRDTFPSPTELVTHLRTHGLRLYQCTWCVYGANQEMEFLAHAATQHPDKQPQAYVRVITMSNTKDGPSKMRVLPLAYLNKTAVPCEDVAPNTTKENPVREAERSIELEKLIGHTMLMMEANTSPELPTEQTPMEEPEELHAENFPQTQAEVDSALKSLLTDNATPATEEPLSGSAQSNVPSDVSQSVPPVIDNLDQESAPVKREPAEEPKDTLNSEIICLDSDEEEDTNADEAPVNTSDVTGSTTEDVSPSKPGEISRGSVTDDVSITKITDESKSSDDESRQNIIDLSDDDPPNSAPTDGPIVGPHAIFKCPTCEIVCKSGHGFKRHLRKCCSIKEVKCPHRPCSAVITGMATLLAHYINAHSSPQGQTLRNLCGICRHPFPTIGGAKLHIKVVHKVQKYRVATTIDRGIRKSVVEPVDAAEPPRSSARKTSTEIQRYGMDAPPEPKSRKPAADVRKRYGVEDIDKLPISAILDAQVYCSLCEFGTKVRLNMVRHLQLHASSEPVARTEAVNPVPHLETNEMHFDRMVNLASSSIRRLPDRPPAAEPALPAPAPDSRYPKHVPERLRYTCGARGCSYISVDVAMFRRHWETLHPRVEEYRCVHCPPNQALDTSIPLSAARILAHLRMHDVGLYACSACSYYHYRNHLVEKHISEKHPGDGRARVKVVREEGGGAAPVAPPVPAGAPTMDLKPWQCGLCKFSSMLRPEVVDHCGADHQSKMQFKCGYCPFRTSTKENVSKHQSNAHPMKPEEVFYYFYREGSIPHDAEGVPLWRKQRQKLGIDDEPEVKTEPEPENQPEQTNHASVAPAQPATIGTPVPIDLNLVKREVIEEPVPGSELSVEDMCKKYGQFCDPDGIKYKCCLCDTVQEHDRDTMKCHLFEELNYRRWECVMCSYKAFHKTGLNEHVASEHSRQFTLPRALPVNVDIEKWVEKCLDHQTAIIETNRQKLTLQKIQVERVPAPQSSPKRVDSPKPTNVSEAELVQAFGDFGTPENQQFCCPKCDFKTKDERNMLDHLEVELNKIRWGCTKCARKFSNFHEAQIHCKSEHNPSESATTKKAIRDASFHSGWIAAVVSAQRQFMKCIETTIDTEKNTEKDSEQSENSLLVARYDEPVQMEENLAIPAKRAAPSADSDDERLVIDEPLKKKLNDRQCPYCDYTSTTYRCVKEHILRHYNMKPYKCMHCPFEGTRVTVISHIERQHPGYVKRVVAIQIPDHLPTDMNLKPWPRAQTKEPDDGTKTVCLHCEKSVPESETESHVHGNVNPEFAKRGEVVAKCCKCLVLRLTVASLQEHFDAAHPNERLNYAYFKLQVDTREILCCAHCYKKFKFLRDLKVHYAATHSSQTFAYTTIPFNHNLHTEGDYETGNKRRIEDGAGPSTSTKRVARKSTSKLPNSAVAKKSTTKLPYATPDSEEYSYYGSKPLPLEHYEDVTFLMPMYNSMVEIDLMKLSGILKVDPRVIVKDCKR